MDLESQPYSWHKVLGIRTGSCWVTQQHHTAPPPAEGTWSDITPVLTDLNYLKKYSYVHPGLMLFFVTWLLHFWSEEEDCLYFSPQLNLAQAFLQTRGACGSTLLTWHSWSWKIMYAHRLTLWQNMNIRDKTISYCGRAVEDLLSPQRARSQAVPCGFNCLTQHCCIN